MVPGLRRTKRPYGVEVVGDPYDVFSPNAIKHPLRPFFRWWFTRCLTLGVRESVCRSLCHRACIAAPVSTLPARIYNALLQHRPPGHGIREGPAHHGPERCSQADPGRHAGPALQGS